ncbi:NADH-quinone oxidoreductase subunit NuoN [Cellulomonas sp. ATA003]|uniref:NADH-quinone oxidoreductase subunit NuoN n=1 Tax=Cellulomonas sp. ATA003 TaxID=3073064 RepID=UPI0028730BDF|nr:NADH-quinone oxidoreductase subunit NuoN [Cellulomonas sp. ATA003]WNB85955.1 NADH-quinone oxidoreductase subunit NuoN [Cellulomonas sp. ATA003]
MNLEGFPLLTALIVLPLVGAVVLWVLPTSLRERARTVAVVVTLLELALGVLALTAFDTGVAATHQLTETHPWIPAIGASYAVGVDGVGLLLVLLSVVLTPLVVLSTRRDEVGPADRLRHYLALVLVLEAFMVAVFAARDVFLFYVLFEAMLIPVYFLIGVFGGAQRRYAAVKFLVFSLAGGLIMLAAVIALYVEGPGGPEGFLTSTLTGLDMPVVTERLLFLAFFLAFAIKAPMWPVHTWLPDAAQNATAGTSTLLVGVLDKVGTFGMLTLCLPLFPDASRWAAPVIIVLAVISVLYGAVLAIGQQDLMRLIAYTSVSHFGFIVLGIFAFTSVSIQGSALYMVNHGLSTGALFLVAGYLVARRGSQRVADFGGLQRVTPVLAGTFLVAGLSALSLPGLSTFVSEFLVLVGTFARSGPAAVVAVLGVVLAALYVLLTYQRVFTGPVRDELATTPDLSARERWAVAPLIAFMVVFGFYPAPMVDLVREPSGLTVEQVGVQDVAPTQGLLSGTGTDDEEHDVTGAFDAPHIDWAQLSPVLLVLGAGVIGVLVEAFAPQRLRRPIQLTLALGATAGALVALTALWAGVRETGGTVVLGGSMILDGPALILQGMVALLALLALLVVADRGQSGEDAFSPQSAAVPGSDYEEAARRKGLAQTEVYPLVLFATGGMMIFPAAGDLLTMFVALEMLSLPLYLLSGLARRRRLLSQEAAMKYFLLGSFASAFFLFGVALLYGFAGSVRLDAIGAATATVVGMDPLLLAGVLLVLVGLLFKVGAVPFQAWTPDVYQGAPTPITGFMAACTKAAAFGAMLRFVYVVTPGLEWDQRPALWTVVIATIALGTLVSLVQTDMKRILGYSAIAHTGFILTGVVALDVDGVSGVMFYLLAYGAAAVGAFAVITLVREVDADGVVLGEATHLSQWAGLGRRSPWLAGAFSLFMLSFAGIPLTAGFVGKFAVFSAAVQGGAAPLAVAGVVGSAIAVFFYIRIVVLLFFTEPPADAGHGGVAVVRSEGLTTVGIAVTAVATLGLGVLPSPVLDLVGEAARFIP